MNFLKSFSFPENRAEITNLALSHFQLRFTKTSVSDKLKTHPNFPGLLSVSDALQSYGVENLTFKAEFDVIEKIPCPFLVELQNPDHSERYLSLIQRVGNGEVTYYNNRKHKFNQASLNEFDQMWSSRIIMLLDGEEAKDEINYLAHKKAEQRALWNKLIPFVLLPLFLLLSSIISLAEFGQIMATSSIFSALTIIGCGISTLLIWYDIDSSNPILDRICKAGKKTDCQAVLNSKGAKFLGISWSAIGFTYFTGIALLLCYKGSTPGAFIPFLSLLSLFALPYIFYSVYYQWRIAKEWCPLCLTVQGILLLQFITAYVGGWYQGAYILGSITQSQVLQIIASFLIPIAVSGILIPLYSQVSKLKRTQDELTRIKNNPAVFEALLQKEKYVNGDSDKLGITLGSINPRLKIIKVCNPYCGPCARAHKPIDDILHSIPDAQVQIIFTASNVPGDRQAVPVKHLMAIASNCDIKLTSAALDDWYSAEEKNYSSFANLYPMNGQLALQDEKISAMRSWCDKNEISFTPTFFISLPSSKKIDSSTTYYQLPDSYDIQDLKYLLA